MRYIPTIMGGSGIPRVTETAPASLVVSVKATAPLLRKHRPNLYHHLMATTGGEDPLGVRCAFGICKGAHGCWHADNRHGPSTSLPDTANKAIMAKRRLDEYRV